jgi:hypothetical protein
MNILHLASRIAVSRYSRVVIRTGSMTLTFHGSAHEEGIWRNLSTVIPPSRKLLIEPQALRAGCKRLLCHAQAMLLSIREHCGALA